MLQGWRGILQSLIYKCEITSLFASHMNWCIFIFTNYLFYKQILWFVFEKFLFKRKDGARMWAEESKSVHWRIFCRKNASIFLIFFLYMACSMTGWYITRRNLKFTTLQTKKFSKIIIQHTGSVQIMRNCVEIPKLQFALIWIKIQKINWSFGGGGTLRGVNHTELFQQR